MLSFLLCWMGTAQATEGLAWQWEAPRQYTLHAQIELPEGMELLAVRNLEAQVSRVDVDVVTTCSVRAALGSGWELGCAIDQLSLGAMPVGDRAGDVANIVSEMDERLSAATVVMDLSTDGRLRALDLQDLAKNNNREQRIYEVSRELMLRAFAAFDLQLPKKGDDRSKGEWKQARSRSLEPLSFSGVQGSVRGVNKLEGVEDGIAALKSEVRGAVGTSDQVQVGDTTRPANLFDSTLEGSARFSLSEGFLVERRYTTHGEPTPSSLLAATSAGAVYAQEVSLRYLAPGEEPPALAPSRALPFAPR